MPAGPSELVVLADESANPAFTASDLLSQAEHGPDSQVLLITTSEAIADQTLREVERQLPALPRAHTADLSLSHSKIVLVQDIQEAIDMTNAYAPEHLIIASGRAEEIADQIINAGSVFLGHYTPESAGDYASGTNHTLPTNGYARVYHGVNLDDFVKKITFQQITREGLQNLGPVIMTMAENEDLVAHSRAVKIRISNN
jgi:histidinol dehydrogenase